MSAGRLIGAVLLLCNFGDGFVNFAGSREHALDLVDQLFVQVEEAGGMSAGEWLGCTIGFASRICQG